MAEIEELAERYIGWLGVGVKSELQRIGYFDAPASAHHHLAEHGGLLKHSVNVTRWLEKLTESIGVPWPRGESIYIVGMLHDVVKAMCYKFQPAGSPQEAFDKASLADARLTSIDDLNVFTSEPVGCEDEKGNYTRYHA